MNLASVWEAIGWLLPGLGLTVLVTLASFLVAVVLGAVLAYAKCSRSLASQSLATAYVGVFRSIPLVSLVILVIYGLPELGVTLDYLPGAVLALSLVGAAFACETFIAGINGVAVEQIEEARVMGLDTGAIFVHIVLPQSLALMVHPFVSLFVAMLLSSSLLGVVGVMDLTATAWAISARETLGVLPLMLAGVGYLAIAFGISGLAHRISRRMGATS